MEDGGWKMEMCGSKCAKKAPEDWRTPKRSRVNWSHQDIRKVWSVAALRRSSILQRHPHRTVPRGLEACIHHLLRFQRPHRPVVVELAGKNLAGEVAEHDGVLRGCVD